MEKCGNCERIIGNFETPEIWKNAVVCADCRAMLERRERAATAQSPSSPAAPVPAPEPPAHVCPNCGSAHITSLKVIYEQGVSKSTLRGVGLGPDGFSLLEGTGRSQSALSARAAPPSQRSSAPMAAAFILAFIGVILLVIQGEAARNDPDKTPLVFAILAFLLAIASFIFGAFNASWNASDWPKAHQDWAASWMCQQCGTTFKIE